MKHLECILDPEKAPESEHRDPNLLPGLEELAYTGIVWRNNGPPAWNVRQRRNKATTHL